MQLVSYMLKNVCENFLYTLYSSRGSKDFSETF